MTYQRISILGCGWLGFPLGVRLLEQDHFVRGSTTTKDKIPLLEESGIEPYYLQLDPRISGDDAASFFNVDTVVLNITPPRVPDRITFMLQQADELVSCINASPVRRLVMVSSTGVYAARQQDADETDPHPPETENGKGLVAMEKRLLDDLKASVAVVRMAGLFGPERNPGRFLSGRQASGNGGEPVHMIHLEDAIGVITALIDRPDFTGIYNACAREHPTRNEFYRKASELSGIAPPVLDAGEPRPWKRIISEKIRRDTGYRFVYDNPIDGLQAL